MSQKITPALIPHDEFHTGSWLLPVRRPEWYYFMKGKSEHVVHNKHFLQSVDKPLQGLVSWLHKRGIQTTPSCTGHVFNPEELEKVYAGLEEDANEIRNSFLELTDIETGRIVWYSDPGYILPWDRQQFLNEVSEYQKKGVLGLRLGPRQSRKVLQRLRKLLQGENGRRISIRIKDSILLIFTQEESYRKITHAWKAVYRGLQTALK